MILTKKEQNIVWILSLGLGAFLIYFGWNWWATQSDALLTKHNVLLKRVNDDTKLIADAVHAQADWEALKIQTLDRARLDFAPTDRLVQTTFNGGGLVFTIWNIGEGRAVTGNPEFMEVKYTGTAITTTARLARFLQYIEYTKLPARIDGMTITTPKPGVDSLRVVFNVSALLYLPPKPPAGRAAATTPVQRTTTGTATGTATTSRPATGPASSPAATPSMSQAELDRLTEEMIKRREAEAARLATMPTTPPPVKKTPEEIEAEMIAKRAAEDMAAATQTSTKPEAPKTAPAPGGTQ